MNNHKIIITVEMNKSATYNYSKNGNIKFLCPCGHKMEIILGSNINDKSIYPVVSIKSTEVR